MTRAKPATVHELDAGARAAAEAAPDVEAPTGLAALREPFLPSQVGKLPRITCRECSDSRSKVCAEHRKSKCEECGNWITDRHVHLDFVGHGFVTQRLLDVDPNWTWEPFALDPQGLPALDRYGNLWIRLTVCGQTRIGVGDGGTMKVLIGDALRNAAMRFGVALDLWARGSEDEKQTDDERLPEPDWTARRCKAVLLEMFGDDKTKAAEAWRLGKGDDREPSETLAQELYDEWVENQPAEEVEA